MKTNLLAMTKSELENFFISKKLPKFRSQQLMDWIYKKFKTNFNDMQNIPLSLRQELANDAQICSVETDSSCQSKDGTTKLLLKLADSETIEMVIIPSETRTTFCLSTQVGCPVGCKFCASGELGLTRNLTAEEIVAEFIIGCQMIERLPDNVVFMGIGEGLLNFDNLAKAIDFLTDSNYFGLGTRRITVSTSGFIPGIIKLADLGKELTLAISLHAPNDEVRSKIIPDKLRANIADIMEASDYYLDKCNRMVTLEYTMLANINDQKAHAEELAKIAKKHHNKVNLIPYNETNSIYKRPSRETIRDFAQILENHNVTVTIRQSRGNDKISACGQLRIKKLENTGNM